jgi:hypothetical protein
MSMRRFTRLTNGFSKKLENHRAAIVLHFAHYNFCRRHQTLRVTPAMASAITELNLRGNWRQSSTLHSVMVCSPHHIHCSGGGDKASRSGSSGRALNAAAAVPPGGD